MAYDARNGNDVKLRESNCRFSTWYIFPNPDKWEKEEIVLQGNSYGKTFNDNRVLDTAFYKEGSTEDYSKLVIEDLETSTPVKENRLSLIREYR